MMKSTGNFFDYIPLRLISWEQAEDGHVFLVKEKTRRRWLKKVITLLKRSQYFHIHLDQLGSESWLLADGKRSILEICRQQRIRYGEEKQIEERTAKFFALLRQNSFVQLNKNE